MKNKNIKVFLKPEDFIDNKFGWHQGDCPGDRALKRHFGTTDVYMGCRSCEVKGEDYDVLKDGFDLHDYNYVKEQYADPKCNTDYYLTIRKIR